MEVIEEEEEEEEEDGDELEVRVLPPLSGSTGEGASRGSGLLSRSVLLSSEEVQQGGGSRRHRRSSSSALLGAGDPVRKRLRF